MCNVQTSALKNQVCDPVLQGQPLTIKKVSTLEPKLSDVLSPAFRRPLHNKILLKQGLKTLAEILKNLVSSVLSVEGIKDENDKTNQVGRACFNRGGPVYSGHCPVGGPDGIPQFAQFRYSEIVHSADWSRSR